MCRLLAFTAIERKNFYEVVGDNFDNFIALSAEHKDGWLFLMSTAIPFEARRR